MTTAARVGARHMPPVLSFEMFPPRSARIAATVDARLSMLSGLRPDFISVTYGAAGSGPQQSREMTRAVLRHPEVATVAHLTCSGSSRQALAEQLMDMLRLGLRDVLALRGDPPEGQQHWRTPVGGLDSAADLVALVREVEALARVTPGDDGFPVLSRSERVSVSVAAYPSPDSRPRRVELAVLAAKQEAGADYAITQVFHRAEEYLSLVEEARAQGITLPILPGVLPYQDLRRLARLEELSGVPTPPELFAHLDVADADERRRRGVKVTLALAQELLDGGAPGTHLYTFNQLHAIDEVAALVRSHRRPVGVPTVSAPAAVQRTAIPA